MPDSREFEVYAASGPWKKGASRPVLVLRKKGPSALFIAVHDPSGKTIRKVTPVRSDKGLAFDIELDGRMDRVLVRRDRRKVPGRKGSVTADGPYVVYFE